MFRAPYSIKEMKMVAWSAPGKETFRETSANRAPCGERDEYAGGVRRVDVVDELTKKCQRKGKGREMDLTS